MSSVNSTHGTRPASATPAGPPHEHERTPDDLLPEPSPNPADVGSIIVAINELMAKMRDEGMTTDQLSLKSRHEEAKKAIAEAYEARKKQIEKESDDGGFLDGMGEAIEAFTTDLIDLDTLTDPFGKLEESCEKANAATFDNKKFWADLAKGALEVGKWAAVAGSVALAVASAGAAAPVAILAIAGAVASCAAAADSTFGILEKCGVDKDTAGWINMGMSLGGAVASGGAGVWQIASKQAALHVERAVRVGGLIANGVSAGATGTAAVAKMNVAAFERDTMLAGADVQAAEKRQARIQQQVQALLDLLRNAMDAKAKSFERSTEAVNDYTQSRLNMVRV